MREEASSARSWDGEGGISKLKEREDEGGGDTPLRP